LYSAYYFPSSATRLLSLTIDIILRFPPFFSNLDTILVRRLFFTRFQYYLLNLGGEVSGHFTMLRDEVFPRDQGGVSRNMRTLRFGLEGAFALLVTVAAFAQALGLPAHGVVDVIAAALGFCAVVVVRVFHLFGA